jgi:hypothetical protein
VKENSDRVQYCVHHLKREKKQSLFQVCGPGIPNTECMSAGSSLVNNSCNSSILFTISLNYLKHSDNK